MEIPHVQVVLPERIQPVGQPCAHLFLRREVRGPGTHVGVRVEEPGDPGGEVGEECGGNEREEGGYAVADRYRDDPQGDAGGAAGGDVPRDSDEAEKGGEVESG